MIRKPKPIDLPLADSVKPARCSAFLIASIGPAPMMRGSMPAAAEDRMRERFLSHTVPELFHCRSSVLQRRH